MVAVLVMLSLVSYVLARGPHHPRGASVSKQHIHYRPTRGSNQDKLINDDELLHDKAHIQEDLGSWAQEKDISEMTDEELEFHYFQLHDYDKNNRLDGLEILQAIHHTQHDDEEENDNEAHEKKDEENMDYYVELIDRVLKEDDTNQDGYLSYPEYKAGRKKEREEQDKQEKEEQKSNEEESNEV